MFGPSGGVKCTGEQEDVIQPGSASVRGGPLSRLEHSVMEFARTRSWAEMKVAVRG
jgi:hypothetical protein